MTSRSAKASMHKDQLISRSMIGEVSGSSDRSIYVLLRSRHARQWVSAGTVYPIP